VPGNARQDEHLLKLQYRDFIHIEGLVEERWPNSISSP
jgi:hypothetical protein